MKAEMGFLENRVKETLDKTELGSAITGYHLEEGQDDDGTEFLRVVFELANNVPIEDEKLETFAETIEDTLSEIDERFASVRFSEAA